MRWRPGLRPSTAPLTLLAALTVVLVARPGPAGAQGNRGTGGVAAAGSALDSAGRCATIPRSPAPTPEQRRAAREAATRAQEAAITSDDATARSLYRRAVQLDPTDPSTVYALARADEAARDARAIAEYCRFLALAPRAPEAADVRQRIAALSFELLPRTAAVSTRVAGVRRPLPSPGAALALGLLAPGLGQYATGRPGPGLLVTASAAAALYFGMRTRTVQTQVVRTAVDPNGQTYQYTELVTSTRRNLGTGVAAAAGISVIGAIEAFAKARRGR